MGNLIALPVFGIILTIICYFIGFRVGKLVHSPLTNPMLIANALVILIVCVTPLSLEQYMAGGSMITMFIVPATTILALRIYRQRSLLRANIIPILLGCLAGSFASIGSIALLCRLFSLDTAVTLSMLPKSVTTAIALELSVKNGGLGGLTVSAVIVTGVFSASISPFLIRLFKLKDPVAAGVALGASGHAIGTAAALEQGEIQGAMGGIAIGIMGIITSLIFIFL
ncbi:LrgB family protein [Treponema primitia]|uniref:LrgB family protein n=1 Tax=Treponema primitia TaxID=88058 RepID=UPI0002555197|nr:LrgB family protein [Treponema primitia]